MGNGLAVPADRLAALTGAVGEIGLRTSPAHPPSPAARPGSWQWAPANPADRLVLPERAGACYDGRMEVPEPMSIQLSPQVEALIWEQVDSGRYATAEEVIEAAVRLLDQRDQQLQQLRAKIQIGLNSGEGIEWTPELMEQLSREADEMYRRGEQPDPDVCP
jgi:antitoxin ParD1/3/4